MHSDKDASKRHAPSKGICSVVAALWPNKLLQRSGVIPEAMEHILERVPAGAPLRNVLFLRKLGVPFWGVPNKKDCSLLGSIFGSPYLESASNSLLCTEGHVQMQRRFVILLGKDTIDTLPAAALN